MREEPDPALLYPEVAAHHSLAAALQAAAADQGLALSMMATPSDPLRHATISSILPHRESLFVSAWKFERKWWIQGTSRNGVVLSGTTTDLLQLPAVVVGWAEGASLNDIGRIASFDLLTGRFEAPDNDPADIIAAEWQWLLKDARQSCWPEYQALIEVAYEEPRLRALYPYTSHWALSFSATSYPFTPSFATLLASHEGEYSLKEWWDGPTLARVATATEAIAWAINRLPERFDPANDRTRDND